MGSSTWQVDVTEAPPRVQVSKPKVYMLAKIEIPPQTWVQVETSAWTLASIDLHFAAPSVCNLLCIFPAVTTPEIALAEMLC